jgi:hypothetical protein
MLPKTDGNGPVVGWTLNWKETFNSGAFGAETSDVMVAALRPGGVLSRDGEPNDSLFTDSLFADRLFYVRTGQIHSASRLRDNLTSQVFDSGKRRLARALLALAHCGQGYPDNRRYRAYACLLDALAREESSDRDEPAPAAACSTNAKSPRMSQFSTSGARN